MMTLRRPLNLDIGNTLLRRFSYYCQEVKSSYPRATPTLFYCNSLWSQYRAASLSRLMVCHNNILKRLLGPPSWPSSFPTFTGHEMNSLAVLRRHAVCTVKSRTEQSGNSVIISV